MAQLWALVSKRHGFRQIWTEGPGHHPAEHGHRHDCRHHAVWPLEREPDINNGETVDYGTGEIVFAGRDIAPALIAEIKREAAARIEAVSPTWKQLNDTREPTAAGARRFAAIDDVRAWSNRIEQEVAAATTAKHIKSIRAQLKG